MNYLNNIDAQLLKWVYSRPFRHSWFIKALIFIGDGPFWMLVVLGLVIAYYATGYSEYELLANLLVLGLVIGNLLFVPMKVHIKRRRPYANLELQEKLGIEIINRDPGHGSKALESFPSGHALWTTLCVILISAFISGPMSWALMCLIPTMMLLRPYLGVHYPSDAMVGFLFGVVISMAILELAPFIEQGTIFLQSSAKNYFQYGYDAAYIAVIALFLYKGFQSWLRRV